MTRSTRSFLVTAVSLVLAACNAADTPTSPSTNPSSDGYVSVAVPPGVEMSLGFQAIVYTTHRVTKRTVLTPNDSLIITMSNPKVATVVWNGTQPPQPGYDGINYYVDRIDFWKVTGNVAGTTLVTFTSAADRTKYAVMLISIDPGSLRANITMMP